jgi:hypothetical protein
MFRNESIRRDILEFIVFRRSDLLSVLNLYEEPQYLSKPYYGWTTGVQFSAGKDGNFSLRHRVQIGSRAHPAS